MMTREEIKEIVDYSQEHGITVKRRLQELNVPESNFYYAKRMYAREDMVPGVEGCFLQITGNPFPAAPKMDPATTGTSETARTIRQTFRWFPSL